MNEWSFWRYGSQHRRSRGHSPLGGYGHPEVGRHSGKYWRSPPSRNRHHSSQLSRADSPPQYKTVAPYDLADANLRASGFSHKTGRQQMAGVRASNATGTYTRKSLGKGSAHANFEQRHRRNEVVSGSQSEPVPGYKQRRKRPHSAANVERVPAELSRKINVGGNSTNDRKATNLIAVSQQKVVDCATSVSSSTQAKPLPERNQPAENLAVGTLFDMASHLDAARKKTRRDFDPDSVTVVRQLDEGSRLLHMRSEFNSVERPDVHDNKTSSEMSPLALCRSDSDCAVRLGAHISETIDRHVDTKKLEQTAKSVSHQLRQGVAKNSEREIVCRQRPILISTIPRSASNIRDKVRQTNAGTQRLSSNEQSVSHMAANCYQSKLNSPNTVQPVVTSVNPETRNASRPDDIASEQHLTAVYNNMSSDVRQLVTLSSTDEQLSGGSGMQSVRRITVGKTAVPPLHLQTKSLLNDDGGKLTRKGDRCVSALKVKWKQLCI